MIQGTRDTSRSGSLESVSRTGYSGVVALVLWSLAAIYVIGTIVDLTVLWGLQRQDNVQWEFVAVTRTAEGWPRLILGVAAGLLALHIRGSRSRIVYGLFGALLLVLGLGGAALGVLAVMEYAPLRSMVQGAGADMLQSSTAKTLILAALYFLLLTPAGVVALRGPRTRS